MKKYIPYVLIASLFVVVYSLCFDSKLDLNGDNATYIQLARNIADGLGYSNVSPEGITPASHFPPGYPLFLAFFVWIGLDSLFLFKVLNGILLCLSLLLLYRVAERLSGNRAVALSASLLACFSPQLMHFSSMAMSEMLYLFCTVIAFFALYRYSVGKKKSFYLSPWFFVALLSAAATYYIRTVGASVLFAVVLFFLFRKEWKAAAASIAGIFLLLLPWSLRNSMYGIESRYFGTIMTVNPWRPELGTVSSVGEMFSKMVTNVDETVIKGFREILFPFLEMNYSEPSGALGIIAGVFVALMVLYGCWSLGGRNLRFPFLGFILANIGLFALWHGGNGVRYVVPVAPFIYIFFYYGIYNLLVLVVRRLAGLNIATEKWQRCAYITLLLALPAIVPIKEQSAVAGEPFPAAYRNYFTFAQVIQEQLPRGAVVCCRKPELFGYFAPSHYAVRYSFTNDTSALIANMLKNNVDFVILEQLGYSSTPLYLYPAIVEHQELFQVVATLPAPDTFLLRFDREKAKQWLESNNVE